MTEKQFNKWFTVFILAGMTIATCIATGYKLQRAGDGQTLWLLLAAFGSLMGVLATVCAANGWIITFLFGLLDVSAYGVVCAHEWYGGGPGLGQAILHFAYLVPMQFVGYFQWRRRGAHASEKVRPRRLSALQRWLLTGIFLVATVVTYLILARFDRGAAEGFLRIAVLFDAIPLVCNVLGQFLMSTAFMEQWILWLAVNVSSIAMWTVSLRSGSADTGYATVYIIKYSFYLINAVNGLRIWLKLSRPEG